MMEGLLDFHVSPVTVFPWTFTLTSENPQTTQINPRENETQELKSIFGT